MENYQSFISCQQNELGWRQESTSGTSRTDIRMRPEQGLTAQKNPEVARRRQPDLCGEA
jgi:hypothetical protein